MGKKKKKVFGETFLMTNRKVNAIPEDEVTQYTASFMKNVILVGDLVTVNKKKGYYRVIRMPGKAVQGKVWVYNVNPTISAQDAKPFRVSTTEVTHVRR